MLICIQTDKLIWIEGGELKLQEVIIMSAPNNDEMEGKWEKAKGWVKDKTGEVTGDRDLEARGEAQRAAGNTQEAWGKVKSGVGDAVKAVGDAIDD